MLTPLRIIRFKKNSWLLLLTVLPSFFSCNKVTTTDGNTVSDISITALKPAHGPYNTIDTLIGKGFDKITSIDSVLINGKKLTLLHRTNEQVIVQIPSLVGTGPVDIWYQGKVIHGPVFRYDSTLMVTTMAGSASASGYVDGQGLNARFNKPLGIVTDQSGNIYVADNYNNAIRKITPQGMVTTLAGSPTGVEGFANGNGSAAIFDSPKGMAIDKDGFLYVADYDNYRIRKVSQTGDVSTFAGLSLFTGPQGMQTDGPLGVATFNGPSAMVIDDQNNMYVADTYNNKIRKIAGGMVSSFAGVDYNHGGHQDGVGSSALFYLPFVLSMDPAKNIYVIDYETRYIRKVTPSGVVTTLFGMMEPGITGNSSLFSATALANDKSGNLYFAINTGIIKMTPDGKVVRYAVGGIGELDGPAQTATYRAIAGLTVDKDGNLYLTDNNRIRKIAWQ